MSVVVLGATASVLAFLFVNPIAGLALAVVFGIAVFRLSREGRDAVRQTSEVAEAIQRLADLHDRGVINDAEFETKKADLLARL